MSGTLYGIWGVVVKVRIFFKPATNSRWYWLNHEIRGNDRMRQIRRSFSRDL